MKNTFGLFSVLLSLATFEAVQAEQGGLGLHKRLFAVPRTKPVVIDAKLDDWDLSGQVWMYVTKETSEMQSAKFAVMYDQDALYLSADIRDPSPLMNRHDPLVEPDKGWDADSCQFRMVLDPKQGYPVNEDQYQKQPNDQLVHMTLWYYTDRQEPCLQLFYGMGLVLPQAGYPQGVVPHDKYQAAYRKADDGHGYTFEYQIPWATLGAKNPPKGGDLVPGVVQFCFSRPDGLKTAGGAAWIYDVMAGPGFPYQSAACWGKVIFSPTGTLARELVEEGIPPKPPLPLTFGYEVPEDSEVTVALFDPAGQMARNLVVQGARRSGQNIERWDGLDDTGKPLPAGTYAWKGLYHQPIKTKFLLSVHNSGQPPYHTPDNTGGWGGDYGGPQAVATSGEMMLLGWASSEAGWGIIRTDLTGKKLWGSTHNATYLATDGTRFFTAGDFGFTKSAAIRVYSVTDGRPLNFGTGTAEAEMPPATVEQLAAEKTLRYGESVVSGLAYRNGTLYASYLKRNVVALYDPLTGTIKETWPVPTPGRLAVRPDGSVLVVSADAVLAVTKAKATPLVTDHLDTPTGITLDDQGLIYVANGARFLFNPKGVMQCITTAEGGRLENVSVFAPDGHYLKSLGKAGGRPVRGRYDPTGMLAPGDLTIDKLGRLWVAETLDYPKRISVWDIKTGALAQELFGASIYATWVSMDPKHEDEVYCHNVLWKVDLDKGTSAPISTIWRATERNMIDAPAVFDGHMRLFTARNGKQYGWGMLDYGHILYQRDGDVYKPIAGTIRLYHHSPYTPGAMYPVMEDEQKFPDGAKLWQDLNDDQLIQENEIVNSPNDRSEVTFNWVDQDLKVWNDGGYVFPPLRIEANGRPVYDFTKPEHIPFRGTLWLDNEGDADKTIYKLDPDTDPGFSGWTRDGKLLWGYRGVVSWPKAISLPPLQPGKFWGPTMPLGVAGDFTGCATYFGPVHIVTRDGLYVAMIMEDGRLGGVGPNNILAEAFSGQLVKTAKSGRYLFLAGDQDGRITEVLGLDTVKRLPGGTVTLTAADAEIAAKSLADYQRQIAKAQALVVARGKASLASVRPVTKMLVDGRGFSARLAYDQENLYVAYELTGPNELVNAALDPQIIFRGGNLLDIQLAADPQADPKRTKPAPGDVRVLITRQNGQPVAVLYRPKVKDFIAKPIILHSPTGEEPFDAIEVLGNIGLSYQKTLAGFTAVATIPLRTLGWTPVAGAKVKLDVGYIFGNVTGTAAATRAYWSNNSFTANVVNDVPNESRLEPNQWGSATVE